MILTDKQRERIREYFPTISYNDREYVARAIVWRLGRGSRPQPTYRRDAQLEADVDAILAAEVSTDDLPQL